MSRPTGRTASGATAGAVNWRLYGERGLAGAQTAVWLCGETVTVEYGADALAQYPVAFEPDERHIREVTEACLCETRYPSPQPYLDGLATTEWRAALRVDRHAETAG